MSSLVIVTCGGTFDLDPEKGDRVFNSPSLARRVLADIGVDPQNIEFVELFAKDSDDMTDADRQAIADFLTQAAGARIVVIHGTDTLVASADAVAAKRLEKTIVFTGAFVPAALLNSDAPGNLGGAVIAAHLLPPGVYATLHGEVFSAGTFRKNKERGRLEAL